MTPPPDVYFYLTDHFLIWSNIFSMAEPDKDKNDEKGRGNYRWSFFLITLSIFFVIYLLRNSYGDVQSISWNEFNEKMLSEGDVSKIVIVNNETAEIFINPDSIQKAAYNELPQGMREKSHTGPHYMITIGSVDVFVKQVDESYAENLKGEKPEITFEKRSNWGGQIFSWVLTIIIFMAFWYFLIGRIAGRAGGTSSLMNFSKSRAVLFEKEKTSAFTFKDVAGYDEVKEEILEIVEFLKNPLKFTRLGAKIPKGVLLAGPSGTGKTLMAKAVAGEAGVPFFSLSGSEFVEMFVGVGASRVRDLFSDAKKKAPCIVFIDEIDSIGRARGRGASYMSNDERETTLNQLLSEMDGFGPNTGVIVMAATNRPDILDPALLRPGRFDRHIYLELPNLKEREEIFKVHLKPLRVVQTIDIHLLSSQTAGFSGADIANVCNEAALIAARTQKDSIAMNEFNQAIERVVGGLAKKTRIITPDEKKRISFHESGHAMVSWKMKHAGPLMKVSIIPRGKSLGSSWFLPEERHIISEDQMFAYICVLLGGRAAEETIFHDLTSGAIDDLEKATKQAYLMIGELGFSEKLANISYRDSQGLRENAFQKPYSEQTAQIIDEEVRKLIEKAYHTAKKILEDSKQQLEELSKMLLEKETVYAVEIEKILGKRTSLI
jgi:AFG3 family protein